MDRDFSVSGRNFKLNKISAMDQFHVVRRMAPILADLGPVLQKLSKMSPDQMNEDQFELIAPIMTGISKISDQDSDKILMSLLKAVEVQQQPVGNWARIATDNGLMIQDLDLATMLQAAGRALMYNMSGFFSALP